MEYLIRNQLYPTLKSDYSLRDLAHAYGGDVWWAKAPVPGESRDVPCICLRAAGRSHASPVIAYSHANAEDLADAVEIASWIREALQLHVVVYEYSGYGSPDVRRGFKPSERLLYADAKAVADDLRERFPKSGVVSFGRSLGSATATALAGALGDRCSALVLLSPFCSIFSTRLNDAFARALFAFDLFIVRDSIQHVPRNVPLLIMHGTHDAVVPHDTGRNLYDLAPQSSKKFVALEGGSHNSSVSEPSRRARMLREIEDFLRLHGLMQ